MALQGDDAKKFIQAQLAQGQKVQSADPTGQKDYGLLGNLIMQPLQQANRLGAAFGDFTTGFYKDKNNAPALQGDTKYLSDYDAEQYKNPLNIAKDAVGLASNFVPFGLAGKGIGAAIKGGAAIGAAQGFGNTYGQNTIEDTVGGTLTGAAGGALGGLAMPLIGKAAGKLANKLKPGANIADDVVTKAGGAKGKFNYKFDGNTSMDNVIDDIIGGKVKVKDAALKNKIINGEFDDPRVSRFLEDQTLMREAEDFQKFVTESSPKGQNWLQKKGRDGVAKQLGATTRKGTLDFTGQYEKDLNIMDSALEFYGLPRNAQGMSQLPEKIGNLRRGVLGKSGKTFMLNQDQMATPEVIDYIKRSAKNGGSLSDEQIKNAFSTQLKRSLPTRQGESLDSFISSKKPVSANELQDIKDATSKAYQKFKKGNMEMTPDEIAQAMLWQASDSKLRSGIPAYSKINDTFETLYTQNDGFRQAFDTGLKGTKIASPQDAQAGVMNWVGGKFNQGVEKVGDFVAGNRGKVQLPKSQGVSQNLEKLSNFLTKDGMPKTRVAQIVGAQAMLEMFDADGNGELDNQEQAMADESGMSMGGINTGSDTGSDSMESIYNDAFQMALQQTGGDAVKARAQAAAMVGFDPFDKKDSESKTPAKMQQQIKEMSGAETQLKDLLKEADKYQSNIPLIGGLLGKNPWDAKRKGYLTKLKGAMQDAATGMEGKSLTDADREYYDSFLPNENDTPEAFKESINAILETIATKKAALQQ